jgi:hypothetical protein
VSAHTPGPWEYRPLKYDDWGWVRGPKQPEGDWPLVACARSGTYETDAELAEHRRNKTDPYEANARLIAAAPALFEYVESSASAGCATAQALIASITRPTLPEQSGGEL